MLSIGTRSIETERLILRKFKTEDCEKVFNNWAGDSEVQNLYCEPVYKSLGEVNELLARYINGYKDLNYYRWAIILKENNECIGQIAYFLVDTDNHFAEVEYCIGKKYQNKGFASEACMSVIKYGFDEIKLNKVQICHKPDNEASKKVILKCGLYYDGNLRQYFYNNGKYEDRLYYSLLKNEFYN